MSLRSHGKQFWRFSLPTIAILILRFTAPASAQDEPNAINSPDAFGWKLFVELNTEVPGTNGKVLWETWALARNVFANPNQAPEWPQPSTEPRSLDEAEPLLQQVIARSHFQSSDNHVPSFDPLRPSVNETRMNRPAFDFIVDNDLYYVEGQEAAFINGTKIDFPVEAREIKARWEPIDAADAPRYHTAEILDPATGEVRIWGLKALHITTKDIPNWFWATFEHVDNPDMERVLPHRDSHGRPQELDGTKWENYVLRGTQIDFIDSAGVPTLLANSIIESGFEASSSCISCHARATIGLPDGTESNRLSVFESFRPIITGSVGIPDENLFWDLPRGRRRYLQLDFVWSLFRAQRRSPAPAPSAAWNEGPSEGPAILIPRAVDAEVTPGVVEILSSNSAFELPAAMLLNTEPFDPVDADAPAFQQLTMSVDASGLSDAEFAELVSKINADVDIQEDLQLLSFPLLDNDTLLTISEQHGISIFEADPPRSPIFFEDVVQMNLHARDTHQVDEACSAHDLSGEGVIVGVWDGGKVRVTHSEFSFMEDGVSLSRVRQADGATALDEHATHVSGTIAAEGKVELSRGMAIGGTIVAHDWFNDTSEMRARAAEGCACSNHSYGIPYGWEYDPNSGWKWYGPATATTDERFGMYTPLGKEFDQIAVDHPSLCIFVAAGNDRSNNPSPGTPHLVVRTGQISSKVREGDGRYADGYDTLGAYSVAKNVITIGAIDDIRSDPPMPGDVDPTNFTSWGPTDDGRIKPDVVANGFRLESTSALGDDKYANMSGTSMATPCASGIGGLLVECFRLNGVENPRSDQLKAALIHTAMSPDVGPTYRMGWGAIRADLAANLIAGEDGSLLTESIDAEEIVWTGETTGQPLRITLTWIDQTSVGVATSQLVNDLDLELLAPDGTTTFYPWSLDPASPSADATADGPNHVDNVERVDVDSPATGQWKVIVRWPNGPHPTPQDFTLAVSGLQNLQRE